MTPATYPRHRFIDRTYGPTGVRWYDVAHVMSSGLATCPTGRTHFPLQTALQPPRPCARSASPPARERGRVASSTGGVSSLASRPARSTRLSSRLACGSRRARCRASAKGLDEQGGAARLLRLLPQRSLAHPARRQRRHRAERRVARRPALPQQPPAGSGPFISVRVHRHGTAPSSPGSRGPAMIVQPSADMRAPVQRGWARLSTSDISTG
jgi:hypothetical protein